MSGVRKIMDSRLLEFLFLERHHYLEKDLFLPTKSGQKGSYHYLVPYIISHLSRQVSTEKGKKNPDFNIMFIETSYNVKNNYSL